MNTIRNKHRVVSAGFTLIELLIVVAIIGLLASVVMVALNTSRTKSGVASAASDIRQIHKALELYFTSTGRYPPVGCMLTCTAANDPFLNSYSVPGWIPFEPLYNRAHKWGGHIGFDTSLDVDGDGRADIIIVLDDDRPGTTNTDNGGQIPQPSLLEIDRIVDDGNLATGLARGNGQGGWGAATGEIMYMVK